MESLARLTYNIERRAQARARVAQRKKDKVHGNVKPSDPRKKGLRKGVKKKSPDRRLKPGDVREIDLEDLAKEIEGTGGYGPGDVRFTSTPAIHEFPGIPSDVRLRFSYLTDKNFGEMLDQARRMYDTMEKGEGRRPDSRPAWL